MSDTRDKFEGLYDPRDQRDACGIGMIAHLKGQASHGIVEDGIRIVENLSHRGACGCDPRTGDGAGILCQVPDEFFRRECSEGVNILGHEGFDLPPRGEYGVGMVFLPQIPEDRLLCEGVIEELAREHGMDVLGWRRVPVDNRSIGEFARDLEPRIKQVFFTRPPGLTSQEEFERKLYILRKQAQHHIQTRIPRAFHYYYICSLSSRTIVYKGMLIAEQIKPYFLDLSDPLFKSAIALVHQRFSTNTFPTWDLAQPFRFLCHNGEINTLRGNINWMRARESMLESDLFGDQIKEALPVIKPMGSDSAMLDNAFEFLYLGGRSLAHTMMMLIPEAWEGNPSIDPDRKGFYEYHAAMMEPWDGPASIAFSDGVQVGAVLDRNGLRPSRYTVTMDDRVILASETGVLEVPESQVVKKGRLQPGKIFLIDTSEGRIIDDDEIKKKITTQNPYRKWVEKNKIELSKLGNPPPATRPNRNTLVELQKIFGYTIENLKDILTPMAEQGKEPVSSMGVDTPIAVLSRRSRLLYDYFKQLFAQVTNPPIDSIREEMVMSLVTYIGGEGNLLSENPEHCHQLELPHPILKNHHVERIRHYSMGHFRSITLPILYHVDEGGKRLKYALDELCQRAEEAVLAGYSILILSDRNVDSFRAPIPALLAVGAVHQHLIRRGLRTRAGIVVESGEPREVHHFCVLLGFGASAVNPYLAFETISDLHSRGKINPEVNAKRARDNFINAVNKGILKVMSKMGISTLFSYHGAQIFEAIGISEEVIEQYFTGTPSRIGGVDLDIIAEEVRLRHSHAFPREPSINFRLDQGTAHFWRRKGEDHLIDPDMLANLRIAMRENDDKAYKKFSERVNDPSRFITLRSLLEFERREAIPIEEVEPVEAIMRRFITGAMSYGSISREAHETIAIAMNRIGGRSNSGEGGEDPARFKPDPDGSWRCSATKQVASGRFGVTTEYLVNASEIQIKIAQGAKPGEGGQLPGHKVSAEIARVRYSTPGVGLISSPPHHDIYSIEDLAQLIHDLKNVNPQARINVKLVAACGVGTIAAGVSKAKADAVLISGYDGGTGASPVSSIHHAGVPWELGLSETHQVLVHNDLRGRIVVQTDGKLLTGRDVTIAALLGAEEYGFGTLALLSMGCIMLRKCHLNTCSVGVATQDPRLRRNFTGKPEYLINYFRFVAEEVREHMASLGFRTMDEMIGQTDVLKQREKIDHWKGRTLDLSRILYRPRVPRSIKTRCREEQDHGLEHALDRKLIEQCRPALERGEKVEVDTTIKNIHRTVGAMLSGEVARRYGHAGLPDDTITLRFTGSAGQSFAAWGSHGITFELVGDANDYVGKGLSGAKVIVRPHPDASFVPEENIIVGNVVLYGAITGECYIRGIAGERFCVRNSGANAVVEGVGDHGCEYMTGGRVVVLGPTGRNFAAGMSGGIAYVYDPLDRFPPLCNRGMVELEELEEEDIHSVKFMLEQHRRYTESPVAAAVLDDWDNQSGKFIKVMPTDYKLILAEKKEGEYEGQEVVVHG